MGTALLLPLRRHLVPPSMEAFLVFVSFLAITAGSGVSVSFSSPEDLSSSSPGPSVNAARPSVRDSDVAALHGIGRSLQTPSDDVEEGENCGLCPVRGSSLRNDVVPPILGKDGTLPFLYEKDADSSSDFGVWTCEEWDAYLRSRYQSGSERCLDARDGLMRKCCDGLPPLYRCTQDVEEILGLFPTSAVGDNDSGGEGLRYRKSIPPIVDGDTVPVDFIVDAEIIKIVDYGVGGGAVEVAGAFTTKWTDERLVWNASDVGCTSIRVEVTDIWVAGNKDDSVYIKSNPVVMADGRVSWSRKGNKIAHCFTDGVAKVCDAHFWAFHRDDMIRYTKELRGNLAMEGILGKEYSLNKTVFATPLDEDGTYLDDNDASLVGRLHFDPKSVSCSICGNSGKLLPNATVPDIAVAWQEELGGNIEAGNSCAHANEDLLSRFSALDTSCSKARGAMEEDCCDDTASEYECESNIHDAIVETLNTISPPDPSPRESSTDIGSKDKVDVRLLLDLLHVFDIDIKTGTMSLLISLELAWFDQRLSWEPFIGGCHRMSYRASTDAELTEIWVPELELLNKVEDIQTLPQALASVRYDGQVKWMRTGVLRATCAMTGVRKFPWDTTGCYLEFGTPRDPLYHRLDYHTEDVEFSDRIKDQLGYQEYHMDVGKTGFTFVKEEISGHAHESIRFQFYFTRATTYYVQAFIILYILFTFLSFGMFFIDGSSGERLGFGSSILFVIVAQELTLSDRTPVADEMLWIYILSFGSKVFVLLGLFQSLFVLYMFTRSDFEEDHETQRRSEETSPLVQELGNSGNADPHVPLDQDTAEKEKKRGLDTNFEVFGQNKNKSASLDDDSFVEDISSSGMKRSQTNTKSVENTSTKIGRKILKCCHYIQGRDLVIYETDSKAVQRIKKYRKADLMTAFVFCSAYSIFVVAMFCII